MESQGEGVGGPLEVAGQKGVLKAQAGVPGEGEAVRQLIHGFGIEGVCFLQNVGGVAVEEAEIDGIDDTSLNDICQGEFHGSTKNI